ncbi:MAG TPA: TonB-dependent receptor plug domain-containing protein [Chitinophagaceae bacterium]|nr:TonB-dependent receptor plug domain-containing protein [Chitinophagaceae bacterium]
MLQKSRLHGFLFILSAFLFTNLHAQKKVAGMVYPYSTISNPGKKMPDIERKVSVSPVTVINGEELREYKGLQDISTIVRSLPSVHLDRSAESTVNLRGLGTNRSLILLNGRRQPVYGQSVTSDINSIPVESIERIEVLKDGAGAVYGSNAVSGVINIITKKDMGERTGENHVYLPFYNLPEINLQEYLNTDYTRWVADVQAIYNATPGQSTLPDNTYGIGGSIKMNLELKGDFRVQELNYFDAGGTLRQKTMKELYPEYYGFEESFYYDCNNSKLHYNSYLTDVNGYRFQWTQQDFRNDQSINTYRDIWPTTGGNPLRIDLTPTIELDNVIRDWKDFKVFEAPKGDCKTSSSSSCDPNIFYGGLSIVLEDFGPNDRLTMPGGFAQYTRMIGHNFGLTGHIGYNFASKNSVDYSKLSILAGASYNPFCCANCGDKFVFTTQALLGVVSQGQKYNDMKFSDTYFTGMFGFLGDYQFSNNTGVQIGAYYNPTFAENNTSSNFVFTGGIRLSF